MSRVATVVGLILVALGALLRFGFGAANSAHTVGVITLIAGAGSLLVAIAGVSTPVTGRTKRRSPGRHRTDSFYAQNPHYADDSHYAQDPRYSQNPRYTVDD